MEPSSSFAALPGRRRALLQAAAAGIAGWVGAPVIAQPREASALVVGNAGYRSGPLRNTANDARAVADVLRARGFDVRVAIDVDRAALRSAIAAHADALARRRGAGLFYYAGHGLQQAWRNYLVPVDAVIASPRDIEAQTVPLEALLAGLAKAGNQPNVIILDACRDFPFAGGAPEARGLSQIDAPPGTLIAYSTAPGNTASDGSGEHGLYTGVLLDEMKERSAKVEDVFKRVRLAVRLSSKGRQVPWESTSLETDFYFGATPAAVPDEAERARSFAAELRLWESIKGAGNAAPFEAYLRQFPSGHFNELAQLQLDRLLAREGERAVQPAAQTGNPFSAGTVRSDGAFKVGDTYRYVVSDPESGQERQRLVQRVTAVDENEVEYNGGTFHTDLLGNPRRWADGRGNSDYQQLPTEFAVGRQWVTRFTQTTRDGSQIESEVQYRIVRREPLEVPAGRFDGYRCEGVGTGQPAKGRARLTLKHTYWMAPEVCRRAIKSETLRVRTAPGGGDRVVENSRWELEFFQQSYGNRHRPDAASAPGRRS